MNNNFIPRKLTTADIYVMFEEREQEIKQEKIIDKCFYIVLVMFSFFTALFSLALVNLAIKK